MPWSRTRNKRKERRILRKLADLPPRSVILVQDEIDLLLFPPLQVSWSRRGQPHRVTLSGQNAKRVLFGTLNIRTGRRLLPVRERQRAVDFCAFLELIHWHYRAWPVVLLLDEGHLVRTLMATYLGEKPDMVVIGKVVHDGEAVDRTGPREPDVVIMDVSMPRISGARATRQIKSLRPRTGVIARSMSYAPETTERMCRGGAEPRC